MEPLVNLAFPPLCLHCQNLLSSQRLLFCPLCLEQLSLIDAKERCLCCFEPLHQGRCDRCISRKRVIHRQMAACETIGPARALLKGAMTGRRECLSAAASLMAYQWLGQNQPVIDYLIPFPSSFWHKQKVGVDPQFELVKEFSALCDIPVISVFKRRFDWQLFLTKGEFCYRLEVDCEKGKRLCDRRVLLIAFELEDVLFRNAGKELKLFFPAQIDGLAFGS